jgi:hypothetical protein
MMRNFLFFIFAAVVFFPIANAREKLKAIDPLEERTKAFEKKIDFAKAVSNHVASEKIVFDWSTIENPPHLLGWEITGKIHATTPGPRAREEWEWGYQKAEQGVGVIITSYKIGEQTALLAIRNFATASNMVELPYLKGPSDLGTISLVSPSLYGYELHWAYRDLEFSVEATDKDLALRTAYWLTAIAQDHRRPR